MGLANVVVPAAQLKDEVKRWCEDIKRNSPIIIQMEKVGFEEYGDLVREVQSPFQRYFEGNYSASEESVERRQAFVERRPVDQSKNLPYVNLPLR